MDLQELRYKLRRLTDGLGTGTFGPDKIKLVVVSAVLGLLLLWLALNILPMLRGKPPGREPDTAAWKIVRDLNEAMAGQPQFAGAAFVVESEKPVRLKVVGGVPTADDLDDLKDYLAKVRPENDYSVEVEIMEEMVGQPDPEPVPPGDEGDDGGPE